MGNKGDIPSIVIIGAGFAGLSAYLILRKRLGNKVDITLIDQRDTFSYIPALHNCLGDPSYLSSIQFRYQKYYGKDFCCDEVIEITQEHVTTKSGITYKPDYIIIATGSRSNTFGNDNIQKYGYMSRFAEDIEKINKHLPEATSITVVGGGYTGVEIISTLAQRFPEKKLRIIHSRDRLLDRYSKHVSHVTHQRLLQRGVTLVMQTKIVDIHEHIITNHDGETCESDMTIFSSGIAINDDSYRENLKFDTHYRALEGDHVFLCGDVAEHGLATTAHNAMIEGRRIGHLVADKILGKEQTYPALENRKILALAMGTKDGMITNGAKGFFVPYLIGFCKWVIEKRVLIEFKYKIMLRV